MGIDFFASLARQYCHQYRKTIYGAVSVLLCLIFFYQAIYYIPIYRPEWKNHSPQNHEFKVLATMIPKDALVVSNVGVHLAWYLERPCIDLPNTLADLQKIITLYPVQFIYLATWPQGELYNRSYWAGYTEKSLWGNKLAKDIPIIERYDFRDSILFELKVPRSK
jgi:hypothetical protein